MASKTAIWLHLHAAHTGSDCLIWPYGKDSGGYARAHVPGFTTRLAHRIMCELKNGKPRLGQVARHTCGKGHLGCANPQHLRWGTVSENVADKVEHGTQAKGQKIGLSVLTPPEVRAIRMAKLGGRSQRAIARDFGVSPGTVQAILQGRTWRHVE